VAEERHAYWLLVTKNISSKQRNAYRQSPSGCDLRFDIFCSQEDASEKAEEATEEFLLLLYGDAERGVGSSRISISGWDEGCGECCGWGMGCKIVFSKLK
jgi:hypothetical protein